MIFLPHFLCNNYTMFFLRKTIQYWKKVDGTTFLIFCPLTQNTKTKAVDLTSGDNRVSSTNFTHILSLNFTRFLKDCCRKIVSEHFLAAKCVINTLKVRMVMLSSVTHPSLWWLVLAGKFVDMLPSRKIPVELTNAKGCV